MVEDSIPEDMSLYIDTPRGLVVITGAGLDRKTAVVGAVGSSFSLDGGIDPLALAR
jgi:hypothetical protein